MATTDKKVAAIRETFLTNELKSPNGYQIVAQNPSTSRAKGGGLAFIIKDDIKYQTLKLSHNDPHIEQQAIKLVTSTSSLTILNIYIPPHSSCSPGNTDYRCIKIRRCKRT